MAKTKNISEIDWRSLSYDEIDSILDARIKAYWKSVEVNGHEAKRAGCIIERIACIDNLREADMEAQSGKVTKNLFIRRHNEHAEEDLRELQMMILTLEFPEVEYTFKDVVSDAGKLRHIAKQKYHPWRILHHAIMRVIDPYIYASLIYDTFACIKGKGLHFGVKRMRKMLRRHPELKWFWKTDFKKFYESLPHETIENALRRKFKDEHFFKLIRIAIFTYCSGEELEAILCDEDLRKERYAYRLFHKPAYR